MALLSAGWERNAETDEYRLPGGAWMSHDAALTHVAGLLLADYNTKNPAESEAPVAVSRAEWNAARASVANLLAFAQLDLTRAQEMLQRIKELLDKDIP